MKWLDLRVWEGIWLFCLLLFILVSGMDERVEREQPNHQLNCELVEEQSLTHSIWTVAGLSCFRLFLLFGREKQAKCSIALHMQCCQWLCSGKTSFIFSYPFPYSFSPYLPPPCACSWLHHNSFLQPLQLPGSHAKFTLPTESGQNEDRSVRCK